MSIRLLGRLAAAGLVLACAAGCGPRQPEHAGSAAATIAATPRLTAVAAVALVRVAEPGQEPLNVTFHIWLDAKDRLRLHATKTDVTFLDLLVEADGAVLAVDPRARVFTRFTLGDPHLPPLLRFLPRLGEELRCGPLAAGRPVITRESPGHAEGHLSDGRPVAFDLGPDHEPLTATIDQLGIRYDRWQDFDGVRRPARIRLQVEGVELLAALREFEALGSISGERMKLTPPEDAPSLALDQFLDQLGR